MTKVEILVIAFIRTIINTEHEYGGGVYDHESIYCLFKRRNFTGLKK